MMRPVALRDALETPQRPPDLRPGDARHRCGLCVHFDGKAKCRLYSYPVRANDVSESFKAVPAARKR
jgi:hypothetical protein